MPDSRREEGVSKASDTRFNAQLRIASYSAITEQLVKNGLINNGEERTIRRHLSKMLDDLIHADLESLKKHTRDLSAN